MDDASASPSAPRSKISTSPAAPPVNPLFGTVYEPYFQPDPGNYYKLDASHDQDAALQINGSRVGQYLTNFPYNPNEYKLTAKDGTVYRYDQFDGLLDITNRLGNVLTFTHNGIRTSTGATVTYTRDAADRIIAIIDAQGGIIQYDYNPKGELTKVTDQAGRFKSISYLDTPSHFLNKILDFAGNPVAITNYDGAGRLSTFSDALGNVSTVVYDELARTEIKTNSLGEITKTTYDERGNVLYNINPVGAISASTFDSNNNPLSITPPCGCTKSFTYDVKGNRLTTIDPLGNVISSTYDEHNQPLTQVDAIGNILSQEYDSRGNMIALTDRLGRRVAFKYDIFGRRTETKNAANQVIVFEYSTNVQDGVSQSMPSIIREPSGETVAFSYDQFSNVTSFTDVGGKTQTASTDSTGRIVSRTDQDGNTTNYSYNRQGDLIQISNAINQISTFEYDANGRMLKKTNAHGGEYNYTWDQAGRLICIKDPYGKVTRNTYRADGSLIKTRQADSSEVEYQYDTNGRRTAIVDPAGNKVSFTYDGNGNISSEIDASGKVTKYAYDRVKNLIYIKDRLNRIRNFKYDAERQMSKETWTEADSGLLVKTLTFSYDAVGKALTANDEFSELSYSYDIKDRALSLISTYQNMSPFILSKTYDDVLNDYGTKDNSGVEINSHLNKVGAMEKISCQGGGLVPAEVHFVRNGLEDVIQVLRYANSVLSLTSNLVYDRAKSSSTISALSYNGVGLDARSNWIGATSLIAPLQESMDRQTLQSKSSGESSTQRVTRISHLNSVSNVIADYKYLYNLESQMFLSIENSVDRTYIYDRNRSLIQTSSQLSPLKDEFFDYDASGNKIRDKNNILDVGPSNRLQSDSLYSFEYDYEGNLVSKRNKITNEEVSYSYDFRNRLTQVLDKTDSGIVIQNVVYVYDATDRRICKMVNGNATYFYYDNNKLWKSIDSSKTSYYLQSDKIDRWLARQDIYSNASSEAVLMWYLDDRQGSIRGLTSAEGILLETTEYDSFGKISYESNLLSTNSIVFTGREYDRETQLYYFRGRYYDPRTSRFLSEDPIGFGAGDFNLYRYVYNNPYNLQDPFGTETDEDFSKYNKNARCVATGKILRGNICDFICTCPPGFIYGGIPGVQEWTIKRLPCDTFEGLTEKGYPKTPMCVHKKFAEQAWDPAYAYAYAFDQHEFQLRMWQSALVIASGGLIYGAYVAHADAWEISQMYMQAKPAR